MDLALTHPIPPDTPAHPHARYAGKGYWTTDFAHLVSSDWARWHRLPDALEPLMCGLGLTETNRHQMSPKERQAHYLATVLDLAYHNVLVCETRASCILGAT